MTVLLLILNNGKKKTNILNNQMDTTFPNTLYIMLTFTVCFNVLMYIFYDGSCIVANY